jgi:hypothetical protein
MEDIRDIVSNLDEKMSKDQYNAILTKTSKKKKKVDLKYLTTCGASGNGIRRDEKALKTSVSLDNSKTVLLLETKGGRNAIKDETQKEDIAKYYSQTKDRLVTPADIIVFIRTFYYDEKKLGNEIENIDIKSNKEIISIFIRLKNDSYLKKIEKTEILEEALQNEITLRSSGILPFQVEIS